MWTVFWLVLAGVTTFVIAAVTVGREARRLDAIAPRAVYDPDEAGGFVMHNLSQGAAEQLTPEELHDLLTWHLAALKRKGLQPARPVDQVQEFLNEPVVLDEDVAIGELIARAETNDMDVTDEVIAQVVAKHLDYLEAIGAIGTSTTDPDVAIRGELASRPNQELEQPEQ
jgi:hypothetical protein